MGNQKVKVGIFDDVSKLCGFISSVDQDGYCAEFGDPKEALKVKRAVSHQDAHVIPFFDAQCGKCFGYGCACGIEALVAVAVVVKDQYIVVGVLISRMAKVTGEG